MGPRARGTTIRVLNTKPTVQAGHGIIPILSSKLFISPSRLRPHAGPRPAPRRTPAEIPERNRQPGRFRFPCHGQTTPPTPTCPHPESAATSPEPESRRRQPAARAWLLPCHVPVVQPAWIQPCPARARQFRPAVGGSSAAGDRLPARRNP